MCKKMLFFVFVASLVGLADGASAGQFTELKVDFALAQWDNPSLVWPETAKPGWTVWADPGWADMYSHDMRVLENIDGSGVEARITLVNEGDGGLKVSGMIGALGGGLAPWGSPICEPLCNSWYRALDFCINPISGIQLAFHNLVPGEYVLYSYHNHFGCERIPDTDDPTWVECICTCYQQPTMPSIRAMSVCERRYLPGYEGHGDAFNKLFPGVDWDIGPFPEGVTAIQNAYDVPTQQVCSDDELVPSEIRFITDGSPVLVLYEAGCCMNDGTRKSRWGGRAILSAFRLQFFGEMLYAYTPSPAHGAENVSPDATLSWKAGAHATWHDVYFGTDFGSVRDATAVSDPNNVYMGRQEVSDTNYALPEPLAYEQTYYWRIDEVNDPNLLKGEVWSFAIYRAKASNPSPANGTGDLPRDVSLSWSPGFVAAWHDVYFGTDFDDVNDADKSSLEYKGNQPLGADTYDPCGLLDLGATYCWRIDEVGNPSTWKGDVWAFTLTDYIIVDDMESYNTYDNMIGDTWLGGGYYNWTGAWLHLWVDPCEPVHAGRQSMKYDYDNSGGWWGDLHYYSEIVRTFADPCDWSASGIKALALYFYGDADNDANDTEQMYMGLKDTTGTYAQVKYGDYGEDMNDIKNEEWRRWNVALSDFNDVNLACVEKVYIGFGDRGNLNPGGTPGGSGVVYFDDIRLHITRCVPEYGLASDLNGDCSVGSEDFAILGSQWLQSPGSPSADIAEPLDGVVNWKDLDVLTENWLEVKLWPAP